MKLKPHKFQPPKNFPQFDFCSVPGCDQNRWCAIHQEAEPTPKKVPRKRVLKSVRGK